MNTSLVCKVRDCRSHVFVPMRMLCRLHYGRWWRGEPMHRKARDPVKVFLSRLNKAAPNGCWEFTGGRDCDGYGIFRANNRQVRASRYSYEIHSGPIPIGLLVCHRCDNPPCCNPKHLYLGGQTDNSADMMARGRWKGSPTTKLTAQQVAALRNKFTGSYYGETSDLAREFGISTAQTGKIIRGVCWKDDKLLQLVNQKLEVMA